MADGSTITGWTKLGGLIRDARIAQEFTQAELAARAGAARSWLARVEAGHRGAELEPLLKLTASLGLSLTLGPANSVANGAEPTPEKPSSPRGKRPHPHRSTGAAATKASARPDAERHSSEHGDNLSDAGRTRRSAWGVPISDDRKTPP
jgi:transcriptional regulator with XRE-family HTH domain